MLNESSKVGIVELLSLLNDNALLSLCGTITQGLIKNKIGGREDAVTAILNYTPNVDSLLRRKSITREILFSYLHKKNIPLNLPATKSDLIKAIAEFWNSQSNQSEVSGPIELLAEQFSQWFYEMLNKSEFIDQIHFYPDATVYLNMHHGNEVTSEVLNNPQQIAQRLFQVKMKYGLFFNANPTAEGVRGWVESHGLVVVEVCGTLHSSGICVGVFEQKFGLVRDPYSDNNWRIKSSELNLRGQSGVPGMPRLTAL